MYCSVSDATVVLRTGIDNVDIPGGKLTRPIAFKAGKRINIGIPEIIRNE
jgi:hypothetical protein